MKKITITLKTNTKLKLHCDEYKEQGTNYVFIISKDKIKTIKESPIDLSGTKGVRID